MSELGPIKPLVQPIANKRLDRNDAKKDERKKKNKKEPGPDDPKSEGHINEYI